MTPEEIVNEFWRHTTRDAVTLCTKEDLLGLLAKEREECAKVADEVKQTSTRDNGPYEVGRANAACKIADLIRTRTDEEKNRNLAVMGTMKKKGYVAIDPPMVRLHGGPFDGDEVPLTGHDFRRYCARNLTDPPSRWIAAVYRWEEKDGKIIGVFAGTEAKE